MAQIHYYDGALKTLPLTKKNLNRVRNKKVWIDLLKPSDKDADLIKKRFKLHPTTVEDIKTHNTRIKIEEFKKYLFVVLYDISEKRNILRQHEIDIILGKDFIITVHPEKVEELHQELEDLKSNNKRLTKHFIVGPDRILHDIMDKVINHFMPIMAKINDEIDELEEIVADNADKETLSRIIEIRKKIILVKKIIQPQKEKIAFLAKQKHRFISQDSMPYFRDLNDDVIKISEMNESQRETVHTIYETYMSTISYNLNEIMKILSIVGAIMLPLTFITGIFGMNFQYMPWLHDHFGFWFTISIMIVLAVVMLIFFQRKRWI